MSNHSSYNDKTNFELVKFRPDTELLEVELNELQEIQSGKLRKFATMMVGTGLLGLGTHEVIENSRVRIANEVAAVDGHILTIESLEAAISAGDTVYLAVYERVVTSLTTLPKYGNLQATTFEPNRILDTRFIPDETAHRTQVVFDLSTTPLNVPETTVTNIPVFEVVDNAGTLELNWLDSGKAKGLPGSAQDDWGAITSGEAAHAEGKLTLASGEASHAMGIETTASGIASDANGYETVASGNYASAEGDGTEAEGRAAHAEGRDTMAEGDYSHTEGVDTYAEGEAAHAEGGETRAEGDYSHAEGVDTYAKGAAAHAEGEDTEASGAAAHAEGRDARASGAAAHAEGIYTRAAGSAAHAEGNNSNATGDASHAEGSNTSASGVAAHSEGNYTRATGNHAHAEGDGTRAVGIASHAEGYETIASANRSHTEGQGSSTKAGATAAHAEGVYTEAEGIASHTEGEDTLAVGRASHAQGQDTEAHGEASHAQGIYTEALGKAAHAQGQDTIAAGESSHAEGDDTQAYGFASHAEGEGTVALTNVAHAKGKGTLAAFGDVYKVYGTQHVGSTTVLEIRYETGSKSITPTTAVAIMDLVPNSADADETPLQVVIEENEEPPTDPTARIEGFNDSRAKSPFTVGGTVYVQCKTGVFNVPPLEILAVEEREYVKTVEVVDESNGNYTLSLPVKSVFLTLKWSKLNDAWLVINKATEAVGSVDNPVYTEGLYTVGSGRAAHAEGYSTIASGNASHAEGHQTTASGYAAHAEGILTKARGYGSHAKGFATQALGDFSTATGLRTYAGSTGAYAEGMATIAMVGMVLEVDNAYQWSEEPKHIIPTYIPIIQAFMGITEQLAVATKAYIFDDTGNMIPVKILDVDIDFDPAYWLAPENAELFYHYYSNPWDAPYVSVVFTTDLAPGQVAPGDVELLLVEGPEPLMPPHAEGGFSKATGSAAHAEGIDTKALEQAAHAEGMETVAFAIASHAEGMATEANGIASHAEGMDTVTFGEASHAEGDSTEALGDYSHAEGDNTEAVGEASHAEGKYAEALGDYSHAEGYSTEAAGEASHAEGDYTEATGEASHAEGMDTEAAGEASHAEGDSTQALGDYSHAEGYSTEASGVGAHAEGDSTVALGDYSHTEGAHTGAAGKAAHAEGRYTQADSDYSHAEGYSTEAAGEASHAEGSYTEAVGEASHAEGKYSKASGVGAHAEGASTANGMYSHSEGRGGIAQGDYSHAGGLQTRAYGEISHASGYGTTADTFLAHVIGAFNKATRGWTNTFETTSDAFIIGNGSDGNTKSNAFRVTFGGDVYGAAAYNSTGADYAEYFEWTDGNPENEDRRGFVVTLDGDKIRKAEAGDYLLGIISATPSVVGDAYEDDWNGRYLTDKWGNLIIEEYEYEYELIDIEHEEVDAEMPDAIIEAETLTEAPESAEELEATEPVTTKLELPQLLPRLKEALEKAKLEKAKLEKAKLEKAKLEKAKLEKAKLDAPQTTIVERVVKTKHTGTRFKENPEWNPSEVYEPRSQRKEWAAVGLMGKLFVRTDGTVAPNDFAMVGEGGVLTRATTETSIRVMTIIDNETARVFVK